MDYEKFTKGYPVTEKTDVYHTMKKQEDWATEAKIKATPTIFINGNELPKQYWVDDLKKIIKNEKKETESGKIEVTETNYALT